MGCLWVNQYSIVPAGKSQAYNSVKTIVGSIMVNINLFVICSCKFFSKALLYFSINHDIVFSTVYLANIFLLIICNIFLD